MVSILKAFINSIVTRTSVQHCYLGAQPWEAVLCCWKREEASKQPRRKKKEVTIIIPKNEGKECIGIQTNVLWPIGDHFNLLARSSPFVADNWQECQSIENIYQGLYMSVYSRTSIFQTPSFQRPARQVKMPHKSNSLTTPNCSCSHTHSSSVC